MPNPTKPTTNPTREELLAEVGGFVLWRDDTPHSNEPTELEYFIKSFQDGENIWARFEEDFMQLIDTYTQAKEREARMDERIRYKKTLESAIETYPIDNDWCRGRRQGIQDCIDDQTEIISELAALKTKQEVAN
ncbi:hypothetical protein [Rhodococcus qingshengii]|uniref:hypothetical protein n=1 Tax=Rhodococcus qingshengii TaxID=334542 RepID=UPI0030189CFB